MKGGFKRPKRPFGSIRTEQPHTWELDITWLFLKVIRPEWDAKSRAREDHVEDWKSHNQAMVLARSGRMRQARTMWERAVAMALQAGKGGSAALLRGRAGGVRSAFRE
jgi:hypothetical protein